MPRYRGMDFNPLQMNIIEFGVEHGLDVSVYANPAFNHMQMTELYSGLNQGLDVSVYANPDFNHQQMYEILVGMRCGLDVSGYANPDFKSKTMRRRRKKMMKTKHPEFLEYLPMNFSDMQLVEIYLGLEAGIDVSVYAHRSVVTSEMRHARRALEHGDEVYVVFDDGEYEWF